MTKLIVAFLNFEEEPQKKGGGVEFVGSKWNQVCHCISVSPLCAVSYISDPCVVQQIKEFISVFNQLDAQNLFPNKFYFMPLHVSSTCALHQKVKIALVSSHL